MEVEFVTLGDAAVRINTPSPTLRGWADKLEELGVHYLERNHRDERIFYEEDIKIFRYMKQQKDLYGRKATTTDLAYVIAESEDFTCRRKTEVAEVPKHKHKLGELDIENIINNPDFNKVLEALMISATGDFKEDIVKTIRHDMVKELDTQREEIVESVREEMKKELDSKIDEIEARRIKKADQLLQEQRETREMIQAWAELPWFKKLFTKNPMNK